MSRSRHLAVFIRSLGGGGGAERMMVNLARAFAARGHRVDLVLGRREGAFFEDVVAPVRLVVLGEEDASGRLPGRTPLRAVPWLAREPRHAWRMLPALLNLSPPWILGRLPDLVRYLRAERPDALLSALNYTNLTALWARRLAGVPMRLVVSERNTLSVRAARERRRRLRALPALARHFYPWADAVAAVSEGVADDLVRVTGLPRERVVATGNPVVTPELEARAREPLDHPWLAPGAPPVVLAAGKLKPQKDFATLLRAFARLRRERPARLVILGEGPERSRLEALGRELGVRADVALPGFVANPFAWMARARVFALSSAWEGLPGVLIQALACGCPVVSTDCPSGPSEILAGGRYGALVPVGDAAALASALGAALDAPPERARLREAVRPYEAGRSADRYLALLLPVEEGGGRRAAGIG